MFFGNVLRECSSRTFFANVLCELSLRKFLRELFFANVRCEHFESPCVGNLEAFERSPNAMWYQVLRAAMIDTKEWLQDSNEAPARQID